MVVSFHHRNGPQVDYCYPPLPGSESKSPMNATGSPNTQQAEITDSSIELPPEWSFMPFICLPDGAHSSTEEFIYFHLPKALTYNYLFGLACFRQIDASVILLIGIAEKDC